MSARRQRWWRLFTAVVIAGNLTGAAVGTPLFLVPAGMGAFSLICASVAIFMEDPAGATRLRIRETLARRVAGRPRVTPDNALITRLERELGIPASAPCEGERQ